MKQPFFKRFIFCSLIVSIVLLPITYLWFSVDGFIPSGNVEPADWLAFWGGFLAFFSSIVLGAIAISQNEQANKVNQRLLNLELKSKVGYLKLGQKPEEYYGEGYGDPDYQPIEDEYIVIQGTTIFVRNVGDDVIKIKKISFEWRNQENPTPNYIEDMSSKMIFIGDTSTILIPTEIEGEEFASTVRLVMVVFMENSRGYEYKQKLFVNHFDKKASQMNARTEFLEIDEPHDTFSDYEKISIKKTTEGVQGERTRV